MQKKIFRASMLLALALLTMLFVALSIGLYSSQCASLREALEEEARVLGSVLKDSPNEAETLGSIASSRRRTLIAPDGSVLFDTSANPTTMENHAGREEIAAAFANGSATVTRLSGTLSQEMVYHAKLLPSGNVLRLATLQRSVWGHLLGYLPWMLGALLVCLVLAALWSRASTKRLVKPITTLDLEHPLDNDCYEELSPLLKRLYERQQENLEQLQSMREQKDKTDALLKHMREGLVVLNRNERVLTLNDAAKRILALDGRDAAGHTLLELNRSVTLQELIAQSRERENVFGQWSHDDRHYHVSVSRIGADEGRLLLLLDDTAEHETEEMRRQFTANVSHELRTPLTTISGYTELMENGMVKTGDEREFVSRIGAEARRMLSLVEDILRLSQLDEGNVKLNMKETDLYALAQDVSKSLATKAELQRVTVSVQGEHHRVVTDPTLAYEIVYNLTDNAIKYNRPGGAVKIVIADEAGKPSLRVLDSGIGIPQSQQAKVFERFYRVDKSRSKETGGTGLGLSIVKHAALLLHADVSLTSEENAGTRVTVVF